MSRERLSNRRATCTFEFSFENLHFFCSYSCFPDGRLAEIFLQNTKAGSQLDSNVRESAIAASIALQHGATLDELRGATLRNSDGTASTPLGRTLDLIAAENELSRLTGDKRG